MSHDMEIGCFGRNEFGDDCTFECRITVASHEEGLLQAAELHEQQRKEQKQLEQEEPFENTVSICDQFEADVYPAPCWDCFFAEDLH